MGTDPARGRKERLSLDVKIRNPNFEMVRPAHHPELSRRAISNDQNLNDRNDSQETLIGGANAAVLNIRKFEFRICFGFRASNFVFMVD
jgi:hypothetical protein